MNEFDCLKWPCACQNELSGPWCAHFVKISTQGELCSLIKHVEASAASIKEYILKWEVDTSQEKQHLSSQIADRQKALTDIEHQLKQQQHQTAEEHAALVTLLADFMKQQKAAEERNAKERLRIEADHMALTQLQKSLRAAEEQQRRTLEELQMSTEKERRECLRAHNEKESELKEREQRIAFLERKLQKEKTSIHEDLKITAESRAQAVECLRQVEAELFEKKHQVAEERKSIEAERMQLHQLKEEVSLRQTELQAQQEAAQEEKREAHALLRRLNREGNEVRRIYAEATEARGMAELRARHAEQETLKCSAQLEQLKNASKCLQEKQLELLRLESRLLGHGVATATSFKDEAAQGMLDATTFGPNGFLTSSYQNVAQHHRLIGIKQNACQPTTEGRPSTATSLSTARPSVNNREPQLHQSRSSLLQKHYLQPQRLQKALPFTSIPSTVSTASSSTARDHVHNSLHVEQSAFSSGGRYSIYPKNALYDQRQTPQFSPAPLLKTCRSQSALSAPNFSSSSFLQRASWSPVHCLLPALSYGHYKRYDTAWQGAVEGTFTAHQFGSRKRFDTADAINDKFRDLRAPFLSSTKCAVSNFPNILARPRSATYCATSNWGVHGGDAIILKRRLSSTSTGSVEDASRKQNSDIVLPPAPQQNKKDYSNSSSVPLSLCQLAQKGVGISSGSIWEASSVLTNKQYDASAGKSLRMNPLDQRRMSTHPHTNSDAQGSCENVYNMVIAPEARRIHPSSSKLPSRATSPQEGHKLDQLLDPNSQPLLAPAGSEQHHFLNGEGLQLPNDETIPASVSSLQSLI